jgi:hypothetical protein
MALDNRSDNLGISEGREVTVAISGNKLGLNVRAFEVFKGEWQ